MNARRPKRNANERRAVRDKRANDRQSKEKKKRRPKRAAVSTLKNIPDWIRTSDLRFRKPSLYPTELRGRARARRCKRSSYAAKSRSTPNDKRRSASTLHFLYCTRPRGDVKGAAAPAFSRDNRSGTSFANCTRRGTSLPNRVSPTNRALRSPTSGRRNTSRRRPDGERSARTEF